MINERQLHDLAAMSVRVGRNPLLVQGPGGNTSIKDDDELWVKASGLWLSEALDRPAFVPIALAALKDAAGAALVEVPPEAVIAARNPAALRPSIETALHALMPHRVVVHAHAVNAMATAIMGNCEAMAAARLDGLDWRWIPYRQPGAALARAVAEAIGSARPDVLLLQNHGVVVGAGDPAAAEALLAEVEHRLALPARPLPEGDPVRIAAFADDRFEVHAAASALAMDADATRLLTTTPLLPDQIVFLGGAVPKLAPGETTGAAVDRLAAATGVSPSLLILPGIGALAARDRSPAADCLIDGLIAVARRIPAGATVSGLPGDEVAKLLDWDAEHYRRALDRQRAAIA